MTLHPHAPDSRPRATFLFSFTLGVMKGNSAADALRHRVFSGCCYLGPGHSRRLGVSDNATLRATSLSLERQIKKCWRWVCPAAANCHLISLYGYDIPDKTRQSAASSGTTPPCKDPKMTRAGFEPGLPRWEACSLTTLSQPLSRDLEVLKTEIVYLLCRIRLGKSSYYFPCPVSSVCTIAAPGRVPTRLEPLDSCLLCLDTKLSGAKGTTRWRSGQIDLSPRRSGLDSSRCSPPPPLSVFSWISRFPDPCISTLFHTHLASPPLALKTQMSRAAQISLLQSTWESKETVLDPYFTNHLGDTGMVPRSWTQRALGDWRKGRLSDIPLPAFPSHRRMTNDTEAYLTLSTRTCKRCIMLRPWLQVKSFGNTQASRKKQRIFHRKYVAKHIQGHLQITASEHWRTVERNAGCNEVSQNARAGKTGDPRENPPTSGIVRHDPHLRTSGVARPGIEPGQPWWEASSVTTTEIQARPCS
ncbi:hypothetical protein PR048_030940 [Dryococelus australis]|uniref:Uncharacterized protein n=1 Tax=Dryococelus australis TaxID=614101 RepID=A0ABQ9GAA5_9NEOP|nr:hypothetical protein PR048_030940 [Dryococelus australis]